MFVSLCLTLPVIQRNLRMVEINKYYYYYYYSPLTANTCGLYFLAQLVSPSPTTTVPHLLMRS